MKNTILAIVIGAIVIGGGGYLVYKNSANPNAEENVTENQKMEEGASGTLSSLFGRGQNLKCTFEHNDGTNVSSGTVYLAKSGKQIRGDFTIQQSGAGPMEAHTIRDGGYNYVWGSFFPQGIKSSVTPEEQDKLFSTKDGGGIDEDTTFDCKPWNVDGSVFSRPSDIDFTEFNIQAGQKDNGMMIDDLERVKKQECDARVCDQAPEGIARQQCLQALGC